VAILATPMARAGVLVGVPVRAGVPEISWNYRDVR